jgi:hypothetical protein
MRVERLRGSDGAAAADLASFADYLLQVGEGRVQPHPDTSYITVPERLLAPTQDPNALIVAVFGDLAQYQGDGLDLVNRAILTPLNEGVDSLNNECVRVFPGEVRAGCCSCFWVLPACWVPQPAAACWEQLQVQLPTIAAAILPCAGAHLPERGQREGPRPGHPLPCGVPTQPHDCWAAAA